MISCIDLSSKDLVSVVHALKILDFANTKWRDRDRSEKITETPAPAVTEPQSVSGGGRRDTLLRGNTCRAQASVTARNC